jgi:hypothetical protein
LNRAILSSGGILRTFSAARNSSRGSWTLFIQGRGWMNLFARPFNARRLPLSAENGQHYTIMYFVQAKINRINAT